MASKTLEWSESLDSSWLCLFGLLFSGGVQSACPRLRSCHLFAEQSLLLLRLAGMLRNLSLHSVLRLHHEVS